MWRNWWLNVIICLFIFIYLNNIDIVNCVSFRGESIRHLKDVHYNGIVFKCSENICNLKAILAFDNFLLNKNFQNLNFNISKYYEVLNGVSKAFEKNSCYAHPNLFFGVYNNLYFNFQFSHKAYNSHFYFFTENDISSLEFKQYLCSQFYIYDGFLKQQFLNYNSLYKNKNIVYNDKLNYKLIQNYILKNDLKFHNFIKENLKIL